MTDDEVSRLHEVLTELRSENTEAHSEIYNLIRGLASRQDKMNGGLATVKWIIAATLSITVPILAVILGHTL